MKKILLSLMALGAFGYVEAAPVQGFVHLNAISGMPGDSVHLKAIPHALAWHGKPDAFTAHENGFTVKAGKNTDIYCSLDGSFYANNVPKLLFAPDKDFIFSARLRPAFAGEYDGGAIMIYSDSSNWAKVLVERMGDGTIMLGSSIVNNRVTDDSYHVSVPTADVHLKLARSGKTYCFYYSADGRTWKLLRTFSYPRPQHLRIGFYAQSPKGEGLLMDVSDIRYKAVAFKDFFTGE